jgi:hypothetical protein
MRLGPSSDVHEVEPARAGLGVDSFGASRLRLRRVAALCLPFALAAAFIVYMTTQVPVRNLVQDPVLTGDPISMHWLIAVAGLILVAAVDAVFVTLGNHEREARTPSMIPRDPVGADAPSPLKIQAVPRWALLTTGLISASVLIGTVVLDLPLWQKTLWTLIPWGPVFVLEEAWKYRHYGFYAAFLALAVLQVGHLGEHSAQVFQLLVSDGDLTRSHGVFGQLDFETVHFVWDTAVWVGGGILVYKFWDNKWLWFSWIVASVHQVEHIYLFWVNQFHMDFWAHGGISGILGQGGLIGSPLSRPYLHFGYNFLVVIPMLFGLWEETKRIRAVTAGSPQERSSSIPS